MDNNIMSETIEGLEFKQHPDNCFYSGLKCTRMSGNTELRIILSPVRGSGWICGCQYFSGKLMPTKNLAVANFKEAYDKFLNDLIDIKDNMIVDQKTTQNLMTVNFANHKVEDNYDDDEEGWGII